MRLSDEESRTRFAAARVARLATTSAQGIPHLVPITFAVLGGPAVRSDPAGPAGPARIVFVVDDKPKTTTRLRRLANIAEQPAACVLVDEYDDDWTRLWWVRADGTAAVHDATSDPGAEAIDALAARYPAYLRRRPRGPVVSIVVDAWTGWAWS